MKQFIITLSAAAVIFTSTAVLPVTSYAAEKQNHTYTVVSSGKLEADKTEAHIRTIAELIFELPDKYSDFDARDQRTFKLTKELMDELGRNELYQMLDSHEAAFDKYNDLCGQEKLSWANGNKY